jgi:hypothetical protein
MRDYLGMITPKPADRQDHGVKGMKWGVRRSSAQLKVAAAKRGESSSTSSSSKPSGEESSTARYNRLRAQAKAGGGSQMSDADLKFFNARTEALAKVNKLNETNPGWLKTTTKNVLQQAAQRQMQSIADGIANKYISGPVIEALKDNSAAIEAESSTPVNYIGKHRAKK